MVNQKHILYPLLFLLGLLLTAPLSGQTTKVMGTVVDAETGEPIPFANVYFQGTTIGVTSDFDGKFSIEAKNPSDTLVASCMGYTRKYLKIRKGHFQEVCFP